MIEKKFGAPIITKDGVTVAKEIELQDPLENMGAQMVREVASKTSDVAGDGTTTATVLAQAIFREGVRTVAAGASPVGNDQVGEVEEDPGGMIGGFQHAVNRRRRIGNGEQVLCRCVGPRAALHANQPRVIGSTSQHPVHTHGQLARDGYFRHCVSSTEFQALIVLPQCEILPHGVRHRFHQQPAHHGVACLLMAPNRRRPPLDSSLGFSPR